MNSISKTTTTPRHLSSFLAAGLLVAGSALAAGCLTDTGFEPFAQEGRASQQLAESGGQPLLMLGSNGAPGGALGRIAASFEQAAPAELGGARSVLTAGAATAALPAGTRAVAFDLQAASDAELASWKPLLDAALAARVPLIIEHANDADRLAKIIGVGVAADLIMVTSDQANRQHVHFYGDNSLLDQVLETESEEVAAAATISSAATLADGIAEIGAYLQREPALAASLATTPPTNGYKYYLLDFPVVNLSLESGQTAILDLDFEAELVRDAARGKKVLFVRPIGSGQHPGTMFANGDGRRGYYQESIRVSVVPVANASSVALFDHQPASPNASSSYTSSTGWTIGVSGQDPQLSFSQSEQETTNIPDFQMINDTAGQVAKWTFKMSRSWQDMVQIKGFTCKVRGVPNLAKSNLRPDFEAMYRSDVNYSGTSSFRLEVDTVFREVSRTHHGFTCTKRTTSKSYFRTRDLGINFGAV